VGDARLRQRKPQEWEQMDCTQRAIDATLRAIPEALAVTDAAGRVRCFNSAAEQLTGSDASLALGRTCVELFAAMQDAAPSLEQLLAEALTTRQPVGPLSARWRDRGGQSSTLELALTLSPIVNADGAVTGVVVYMRSLKQQLELEYAKSGFYSLVSHELRSRLTSISTSAELLLGADLGCEQSREILDVVRTQSRRLASFFERLMDVDVLRSGQVTVRPQPVAVLPLIRTVIARFEAETRTHTFRIRADHADPVALADEDKTETILYNLVENAINYSPGGGEITIIVSSSGGPDEMIVSVQDQGVGIAPEHLTDVFRRSRRVSSPGERPTYGHGLGLYIAQGFAEAQGGRIWAESTVGVGSTFSFTLPRLKDEAAT
jgi:PAS domain S-box-containing protein